MSDPEKTDHLSTDTEPKSSETDPPAANQPVDVGDGENAAGSPDQAPNASGRRANDPSLSGAPVPEAPQVPFGKPDGEVDTSR
jgi:hypothetical protein